MNNRLQVFSSAAALAGAAAETIIAALKSARPGPEPPTFVLSGGSTPRAVYELLATETYRDRVDWPRVHVFWGDERCVPPTSAESNYRMADEAMLRHVPAMRDHIHRIAGEKPPHEAARLYEEELRLATGCPAGEIPRLSLILLGLGEDGHTASLFPGSSALGEQRRLVTAVSVERAGMWRVTMTYPLLNNARTILFLVSGASKAAILRSVLTSSGGQYPAGRIAPASGDLFWYVDQHAASFLLDTEKP